MSPNVMATRMGVIPCLRYRNALAGIDWLCETLGFERGMVVPGDSGTVAHAELRLGGGMVMVGSAVATEFGNWVRQPDEVGGKGTQGIYLVVDDPDAVHARVIEAGGRVVVPIRDEDYGGRGFTCLDPEGHVWSVGSYDPWASNPVA